MSPTPVLEIGGSHVTAAAVDLSTATVGAVRRWHLDPGDSAENLLQAFTTAGKWLHTSADHWGIAIPGPFDYARGIGRFTGVGKFDCLNGVDVRAALLPSLDAAAIAFLNDADAFAIGEALAGAAQGYERAVFLTLGSGIGSAFLYAGVPVTCGPVPPDGHVHYLQFQGADLEEAISRRAMRRAYAARTGVDLDVADIAALARAGDAVASAVWQACFAALTATVGPWITRFGGEVVVVGGSIAKSWDLVEPALTSGFAAAGAHVPVLAAAHPDDAALFGAAHWAQRLVKR